MDKKMVELTKAVEAIRQQTSARSVTPMYEGNNVCAWIGFKHINYLVEHAILAHIKGNGLSSRFLYEEYGLGFDVVDIDTRILSSVHLDDELTATVIPAAAEDAWTFKVVLSTDEGTKVVTSKVSAVLRRDTYIDPVDRVPAELRPFAAEEIERPYPKGARRPAPPSGLGPQEFLAALVAGANGISWSARIGYPSCHYNERMAMSGYLRLLEEAKDRFVDSRGISVKTLLDEHRWIPAVPHSQVTMLAEARMEETLYIAYTVDDVFKNLTYRSRFDCFVLRDGTPVHTATGTVVHGYAQIHRRDDWGLVNFDDRVLAALTNA
ncbi:thioesterase family protein [Nocardia sp. NPDC127579]|uniref:thioesterase family protein n=1 Tax=Nocardia sp. NPDC127579 TaxID=3345402 RepID=UPI003633E55A